MNREEKEVWLKETYDYLKNTDFDKVKCQSDIYLDYIMLYEENEQLKENWNKLKEWIIGEKMEFYNIKNCLFINYNDLFWKMQELENGDSNE